MRIGIIGYGKMGREIEEVAQNRDHEIVLRISRKNKVDLNEKNLKQCDVAIEFTGPTSAFKNISYCLQQKTPVISGSTGWLDQISEIEALVRKNNGSFLYASNFSLGVNIAFDLNERLAKLLSKNSSYQIEINETHHKQKLDAPSGTAISFAKGILKNAETRFENWILNNKQDDSITINAFREDGVPGTHEVIYNSEIDEIKLTHTAHNRKGFALGAVMAAEYIHQKQGIFTMKDVLNV